MELGMQWFRCGGQRTTLVIGPYLLPSRRQGLLLFIADFPNLRILLSLSPNLLKEHGLQSL